MNQWINTRTTGTISRLLLGLLGAWGLVACGPALNNDRFEADAAFVSALPLADKLQVNYPGESASQRQGSTECDPDALRSLTQGVAQSINGQLLDLLQLLDKLRERPPSERTALSRVWGPYQLQAEPEIWLRLEVIFDDPMFRYNMTLGDREQLQADVLMTGSYLPGSTAEEGMGAFTFDLTVRNAYFPQYSQVGALNTIYSTVGKSLDLVVEGRRLGEVDSAVRVDKAYAFYSPGDASGTFYFDWPVEGSSDSSGGRVTVWSGWDATKKGRSDASFYLSTVDSPYNTAVECWNAAQEVTFFEAACGGQGEEATCSDDVVGWNE